MKKLMIAATIVCVAAVSQAMTFNWSAASGTCYAPGTTTGIAGTAYLFDYGTIQRDALVTALNDGTYASVAAAFDAVGVKTADTITMSGGKGTALSADFEYLTADTSVHKYYAAIISSSAPNAVYITNTKDVAHSATAADKSTIALAVQPNSSLAIKTAAADAAGWYQTAPEPTSGLLLLLGVAGLALRRRRA